METVLLLGNEKNMQVTNTILGAIRAVDGSVLHITQKSVVMIPPNTKEPWFLILDNPKFPSLQLNDGIVVFKPGISFFQTGFNIPEGFFAIVDPENEDAVNMLKKKCMQTITCGMSHKDSITFSSLDQENAVISLQRELKTLNGQIIEPRELPVRFTVFHSQYAILSAVAVLLLSGHIPDEELFIDL